VTDARQPTDDRPRYEEMVAIGEIACVRAISPKIFKKVNKIVLIK